MEEIYGLSLADDAFRWPIFRVGNMSLGTILGRATPDPLSRPAWLTFAIRHGARSGRSQPLPSSGGTRRGDL